MPRLPRASVRTRLADADARNPRESSAAHRQRKGRVLEDVVCELLGRVPGVSVAARNALNVAGTQEVDILFWNEKLPSIGLYHLDTPFLVECKNWSERVSSREIVNFAHLLKTRACRDGILVAANGITGTPGTLTEAYYELSVALADGRRILVVDRSELEARTHTDQIVHLLKLKILELTVLSTMR